MSVNHHAGGGRLTDSDHERIRELAAQGLGPQRIAHQIGRHPSSVNWFMYTDGLRAPAPAPEEAKSYIRGGRVVHLFTATEDAYIEVLRVQDFSFAQIADLATKRFGTNRSAHVIQCRLIMLAARE